MESEEENCPRENCSMTEVRKKEEGRSADRMIGQRMIELLGSRRAMRSFEDCHEVRLPHQQILQQLFFHNSGLDEHSSQNTVSSASSTTISIFETNSALDLERPAAR